MARSFPAREIRDALGAARLLYASRLASGRARRGEPDPLIEIGERLRAAQTYERGANGSPAQIAAIESAETALVQLEQALNADDVLGPVARIAADRVKARSRSSARRSR